MDVEAAVAEPREVRGVRALPPETSREAAFSVRSWALTMSRHELRAPCLCRWVTPAVRRFSPCSGRADPGCRCYRRVADGDREGEWTAWRCTSRGEP